MTSARLFTNATICTLDPAVGVLTGADLLTDGLSVVAVGHGLSPGGAVASDCSGHTIVPMATTLGVGSPAAFAVLRGTRPDLAAMIWRPAEARSLVGTARVTPSGDARLGTWIDRSGHIHQRLSPDGRYDETRNGRRNAYQGAFWIAGDAVVYRDDLGFWAYGWFREGLLHHAGYVFDPA